MSDVGVMVANGWFALCTSGILVHAFWPWDWRGRRRAVVLRRNRRPFE